MLDKFLPPTDSLYKFLAISGLLLIGISFIPDYFLFRLVEQQIVLKKEAKVLEIEAKALKDSGENLGHLSQMWGNNLAALSKARKDEISSEITKLDSQNLEKSEALNIKMEEIKSNNEILSFYKESIEDYENLSKAFLASGIITVIFGFGLWYIKIQRPNDLILESQIPTNRIKKPNKRYRLKA